MTNKRFNIYLFLLAAAFLGLAYAAHLNEAILHQTSAVARTVIGFVVASPFVLSIFVFMLRMKALKHDEYQANMLQQRMVYATMAAMFYALIKGFTDQYDEAQHAPLYIWPAVYWYLTFWFSSLFGPYKA